MKVIAGIVSYNPEISLLQKEIDNLIQIGIEIVLIDNNSQNAFEVESLFSKEEYKQITLIKNKVNNGTAGAHNQILQYALQNGYDWAITFDQDSVIPENLISEFKKYIQDDVGIISPYINYLTENGNTKKQKPTAAWEEKEWTIASASMIRVKAWQDVGGFDTSMFIDLVDRDFGARIKQAGYRIIQVNSTLLDHHLGNLTEKRFLGKTFFVENHSPLRKYYKARNYIYLKNKGQFGFEYAYGHIVQMILETIAFEDAKKDKIMAIMRGMLDGRKM